MEARKGRGTFVLGLLVLAQSTACATTASITRYTGPDMEGKLVGGSADAIVVRDEAGLSYSIGRGDVREVDHPGNVVATVGGVLAGYGVLNVALGLERCQDDSRYSNDVEQGAFCTGMFAPAVVGLSMLAWGLIVYLDSKNAAEDSSLSPAQVNGLPRPYQWPQLSPAAPGQFAPMAPSTTPQAAPATVTEPPPVAPQEPAAP